MRDVDGSGDATEDDVEPNPTVMSPALGLREIEKGTMPTLDAAEGSANGVDIGVLRADDDDDWICGELAGEELTEEAR